MKKILLLTKNNPTEIYDVMMRLYRSGMDTKTTLFFSPQYTAMLAAESQHVGFVDTFYSAVKVWEEKKDQVLEEHPEYDTVVVLGVVDENGKNWYDAIIGLENDNIDDYKLDEDYNITKIKLLTLKDAEIKFKTLDEALTFIEHVKKLSQKEKEYAIQ